MGNTGCVANRSYRGDETVSPPRQYKHLQLFDRNVVKGLAPAGHLYGQLQCPSEGNRCVGEPAAGDGVVLRTSSRCPFGSGIDTIDWHADKCSPTLRLDE